MHELSVARSLIGLASAHARSRGASRIRRLHVRLGERSVVLRSFYFCFGPASRGTMCEGADLEVEQVPLTVHCRACDTTGQPTGPSSFRCPRCGSPASQVVTGREMQLVGLELEFPGAHAPKPQTAGAPEINSTEY